MTKGEIVGQSESCMVCLSLVLSLMSTESLLEVLMSTKSLTVVFDFGLVLGLGPLWSPSFVLFVVVSGRSFSSDSSPSLKPLGALEMSQKPLWVG